MDLENEQKEERGSLGINSRITGRTFADRVLRWFRVCAACGGMWPPIDVLCENCWRKLEPQFNLREKLVQNGYPFRTHSLITWTNENDHLVRPLAYSLKGGWAASTMGLLVERLTLHSAIQGGDGSPIFIYPPAFRAKRFDHAALLAFLVAQKWGCGLESLHQLEHLAGPKVAQKSKTATDRAKHRFKQVEKFSGLPRSFVFIDDVITTGSTAMAAYMALGDPEAFAVWTLICRPKLAGKSSI